VAILLAIRAFQTSDLLLALVAVATGAFAFGAAGRARPEGIQRQQRIDSFAALFISLRGHSDAVFLGLGIFLTLGSGFLALEMPRSIVPLPIWIVGLAFLVVASIHHDGLEESILGPARRLARSIQRPDLALELAGVATLTFLALVLRVWDLGNYPVGMHGDEADSAVQGIKILLGTFGIGPFSAGWAQIPSLYNYAQALFMAIFGADDVGVRTMTALAGTSLVPMVYFIARLGWGRLAGFTSAGLLAVSHLFINYSRIAGGFLEPAVNMCLLILLLALVERGYKHRFVFALIGLDLSLSLYQYSAGRLVPVVGLILILLMALRKVITVKQVAATAAVFLLASGPLFLYYSSSSDALLGRTVGVSIFSDNNITHTLGRPGTFAADGVELMRIQVQRSFSLFLGRPDASRTYFSDLGAPGFDVITSILFWVGVMAAVRGIRRPNELAVLVTIGAGILLGMLANVDQPSANRVIVVLPTVTILAGLGLHAAAGLIGRSLRVNPLWFGGPVLIATLIYSCVFNFDVFFTKYPKVQTGVESLFIGRAIRESRDKYEPWLIMLDRNHVGYGAMGFLAYPTKLNDLTNLNDMPRSLPTNGRGLAFIAVAGREKDIERVRAVFPGGTDMIARRTDGRLVYVAYYIPGSMR